MAPSPFEDEHTPLFTVGQVADMLAVKQAFLRRVDELRVVSPQRSAGGQRRYTRYEIRVIQQVVSMADEGITLQAIRRIIDLEQQLAEVTRERDELARRLASYSKAERVSRPTAPWASASCSSTGSAAASADRCSGVSSSRLAISIRVVSVRMRSSASWPCAVMARVLARASLGSAVRCTYPLSSSAVTSRVSVDGAMPSAAARSPSRIGPVFPIVASAASWVGVRPASSWRRSRRDSRARATRSRATSISSVHHRGFRAHLFSLRGAHRTLGDQADQQISKAEPT